MAGSHSDWSTRKINNLLLTREINSLPRVLSVSLQSVRHYALQRCRSVSWSRSPSKSTVPDSVTPAPFACHSSRTLCQTDASVQRRTSPGHKHDQAKTVDIRLYPVQCCPGWVTQAWLGVRWYGTEQGFTSHSKQKRTFRRRSSQPISWPGTEKNKS